MDRIAAGVFGLVVGSFLNVLIDRIPKGENVIWMRSHCDFCKKPLRWYELVPVFSFLIQGGRCRRCHKRLSLQYPLIELATAAGFIFLVSLPMSSIVLVLASGILCVSIVLFVIDCKYFILPDPLVGVLFLFSLANLYMESPADRAVALASGMFAGLGFLLLWLLTKQKGLGFGDVKLVTVLGLLLGYPNTIIMLYIAFLTGAIWGVILLVAQKAGLKSRVAFGPFLFLGAAGAALWGGQLWAMWLSLL